MEPGTRGHDLCVEGLLQVPCHVERWPHGRDHFVLETPGLALSDRAQESELLAARLGDRGDAAVKGAAAAHEARRRCFVSGGPRRGYGVRGCVPQSPLNSLMSGVCVTWKRSLPSALTV
jgi:hypothetical protein